jgi:hypothetical protein
MNTATRYQDMTKSELLEVKTEVDKALEQKKYISLVDSSIQVASTFKGTVPTHLTKEIVEKMIEESMS